MKQNHNRPTWPATLLAALFPFLALLPGTVSGVNLPVLGASIRSVTFSGSGYSHLTDDSGNDYNIPQWAREVPAVGPPYIYNRSVSYMKSTKPVISATFQIIGLLGNDNMVTISASGTDDINLPPRTVPVANGLAVYPATEATKAWPDSIKFYDRHPELSDSPQPFTLRWTVAQGTRSATTPTTHQVYVTLVAPTLEANRETLFYLACHKPSGMDGSNELDVVDKIFDEYRSRNIQSIDPESGDPAGRVLTYYKGNGSPGSHILEIKDGVCGKWADFMVEVLSVHGIVAISQGIVPTGFGASGHVSSNTNAVMNQDPIEIATARRMIMPLNSPFPVRTGMPRFNTKTVPGIHTGPHVKDGKQRCLSGRHIKLSDSIMGARATIMILHTEIPPRGINMKAFWNTIIPLLVFSTPVKFFNGCPTEVTSTSSLINNRLNNQELK